MLTPVMIKQLKKYRKTDPLIIPYLRKQILSHTDLTKSMRARIEQDPDSRSYCLSVIRATKQIREEWIYRYEKAKARLKRKKTQGLL